MSVIVEALSSEQRRMWFVHQLAGASPAHHECRGARFTGKLDPAALEVALTLLVRRHEILRTSFAAVGGEPMQCITDDEAVSFQQSDLSAVDPQLRAAAMQRLVSDDATRAFDLSVTPLWRARLVRLGQSEYLLVVVMHHIISDGDWTFERLLRELVVAYEAIVAGTTPRLPPLWSQYRHHASRQRAWADSGEPEAQLAFWRSQLAAAPPPLELPSDHPRRPVQSFETSTLSMLLPSALVHAVDGLVRTLDADRFSVLLAAFHALCLRMTGQQDIITGTIHVDRADPELAPLLGDFGNPVMLRTPVDPAMSFADLVARQHELLASSLDHAQLGFDRVIEALHLRRDLSPTAPFNVLVVMRPDEPAPYRLPDLTVALVDLDLPHAQFETILAFRQTPAGLACRIQFDNTLHERDAMDRLSRHFVALLEAACADPSRTLLALPLMSAEEQRELVTRWNDTEAAFPSGRCIHELFDDHAHRAPNATALVFGDAQVSYSELRVRANRLAHRLRKLGVGREVIVGVSMTRSVEMIVSVLAVWKAGGAFVPLDPAYPSDRLAYMLQDSAAPILLTQRQLVGHLPEHDARTLIVDEMTAELAAEPGDSPSTDSGVRDLAYVIYTSGSTGRPKGVMVEHVGVPNMVAAQQRWFGIGPDTRILQFSSFSFDASVFEIAMALLSGATLVQGTQDQIMPGPDLARFLTEHEVNVVVLPPSALAHLPQQVFPHLRTILVAGEACPADLVQQWGTGRAFFNAYGPTETTVWATIKRCAPDGTRPSIGRPIQNFKAYVLDERGTPAPWGAPGELYVGGVGVARGYLRRPELTAERFVPDPFAGRDGARLYRTGDLVRYRADGDLDFLGRIDHQVKVRGFRIELGEIEAVIGRFPGVRENIVLVRVDSRPGEHGSAEPSDARVVAYVVAHNPSTMDTRELREHVRASVPAYMVPSAFLVLPAFPLTPNGKIDRAALPSPDDLGTGQQQYVAPRNVVEQRLAEIFSQVLRRQLGIHDGFFDMGGHSLLAAKALSIVREKFGITLPVRRLFEKPTIAELAETLAQESAPSDQQAWTIQALPKQQDYPLSYAQQRIWFVDSIRPGNDAYDCPAAFRLRGALDVASLSNAVSEVARRHASLRTIFVQSDEQVVQRVSDKVGVETEIADLRALESHERDATAAKLARDAARHEFDLAMGPLLRVLVIRLADDDHLLVVNMHHIICDGWSMGIFFQELSVAYAALRAGRQAALPELPVQVPDYAVWQRNFLQDAVVRPQLEFWRQYLSGAPQLLELPTDHPRPPMPSFRGQRIDAHLGKDVLDRLHAIGREEGASVFMTLLAAFKTLLSRYAGAHDILVGIPTAGRNQREVQGLIGMFANILVVRTDLSGEPTYRELLRRVRESTFAAFEHQDIPFERLVEELRPSRDLSHNPLVQVALVPQDMPFEAPVFEGLEVTPAPIDREAAQFDLVVFTRETDDGIALWVEYTTDLFDRGTMTRWMDQFVTLVTKAAEHPDKPVATLPLLDDAARRAILVDFNRTDRAYPRDVCMHELFAAHARRAPDAVALDFPGALMTYGELERKANQLARHLLGLGVSPGDIIGVALPQSADFVLSLLAVIKAGASYVPIAPDYPPSRVAFMLDDARIRVLVTREGLLGNVTQGGLQRVQLDRDAQAIAAQDASAPPCASTAESIAYVVYTSGSTGVPKGARIRHRGVVRLLVGTDHLQLGPDDRFAQVANVSFDVAGAEIWGALLHGARLIGVAREVSLSPDDLADFIASKRLSTMMMTAPLFHQVAATIPDAFRTMKQLLIGGEALDPRAVRRVLDAGPPASLINSYGPAESTVCATWHKITHVADDAMSVPIGRPIANTKVYVLDEALEPVPPGVPGELFIGGDGLADGYLHRPELTSERFLPHPFGEPGERIYRTGDLARIRPDGLLEFLGRVDFQVKIRGMRIELGEIEATIAACPGVRQCVVVAREFAPGDRRLVAYFVLVQDAELSAAELRKALSARLPEHMVPGYFVQLDQLPLTQNMKVDREALPAPALPRTHDSRNPSTAVEQRLASIWCEVLELDRVGADDSFFDLGGHSLLATRVLSRIRRELGVKLTIHQFFEAPTIEALAAVVDPDGTWSPTVEEASIVPTSGMSVVPIAHGQRELWRLNKQYPGLAYNLPVAFRLRGQLNAEALELCVQEIVWRHEPFRAVLRDVGQGEVLQIIAGLTTVSLHRRSVEGLPTEEREAEGLRLVTLEARRPFDLEQGPLARALLVRLAPQEHLFLFCMHHIAGDGWSLHILFSELQSLYGQISKGKPPSLEPLPILFRDFVVHQLKWVDSEEGRSHAAYWRKRLAGAPPILQVPSDHPRSADRRFTGSQRETFLAPALLNSLGTIAQQQGATVFMTLLAAFYVTLFELSGERDIVIAATTSGRTRRSTEGLIGCCFNKIALRGDLSGHPTFRELIGRVRGMTIEAFDHQDVPFDIVVRELGLDPDAAVPPLAQVGYAPQDASWDTMQLHNLELTPIAVDRAMAPLDLILYYQPCEGGVRMWLEYRVDLFEPATIDRMLARMRACLERMAASPDEPVDAGGATR